MTVERDRQCQVWFGPSALEADNGGLTVTEGASPANSVIAQTQGTGNIQWQCKDLPPLTWDTESVTDRKLWEMAKKSHARRRVQGRQGRHLGLGLRHLMLNKLSFQVPETPHHTWGQERKVSYYLTSTPNSCPHLFVSCIAYPGIQVPTHYLLSTFTVLWKALTQQNKTSLPTEVIEAWW